MSNLDLFIHPITGELTPFHPRTGLQALCSKKRGGWVWPVMGASEDHDGGDQDGDDGGSDDDAGDGGSGGGKKNAVDQHGNDLGYADTAPSEMSDAEQAKFYKHQQRRKDDKLKEYGGITPEEAKRLKADADKNRRDGMNPNERALEDARSEAASTARQESASQWAPELAEEIAARFIPDDKNRQTVMAGIDPMRFVKDGKFDRQGLIDHLTGLQDAFGGGAGNGYRPSQWGQGNGRPTSNTKQRDEGLAEAERRGYITKKK